MFLGKFWIFSLCKLYVIIWKFIAEMLFSNFSQNAFYKMFTLLFYKKS